MDTFVFFFGLQDTDGELAFGWDEHPEKQQANRLKCCCCVESPNPQEKNHQLLPADLIHADILFR